MPLTERSDVPAARASIDADALGARVRMAGVSLVRGGCAIVDDVTLDIPLDRRTVIIGPNGAGKTTLLLLLQGVMQPDRGTLRVGAEPSAPRAEAARRFALVFQKPVMLRRSTLANIEHALACAGTARRDRRTRAWQALRGLGLERLADRPARRLSGGEQQRVAIARAHALEPACLLCDEPTASLDPDATAAVERLLLDVSARGCGIVLVTHDLGQARRLAEHVVFMHGGRIGASLPATRFFADPGSDAARRFLAGHLLSETPAMPPAPVPRRQAPTS